MNHDRKRRINRDCDQGCSRYSYIYLNAPVVTFDERIVIEKKNLRISEAN